MYGLGISREGDLIDLGVLHRIVAKSGSWYSYGGERIGQGRENTKKFLQENPDIRTKLETELRTALGLQTQPQPELQPKLTEKSPPPSTQNMASGS